MGSSAKLIAVLSFALCAAAAYAQDAAPVAEQMSILLLQLGVIILAVRGIGPLSKKLGFPSVLGELLIGILIGPFALGSLSVPGFPRGIFPLEQNGFPLSAPLYGFAMVAAVILLFVSGMETDLTLFLKYSGVGVVVGFGGVACSFTFGALTGVYLLGTSFGDPRCLLLGILSAVTSVGITARILSDQRQIDSPEGVTILAAAVFDDLLGIVLLALTLGIMLAASGTAGDGSPEGRDIVFVSMKVFGISVAVAALGVFFSRRIASLLKLFKQSYDFSIFAIGIAFIVAGIFEAQGITMVIGAYAAGLSLSKTDVAMEIQERIHGLYEFFVPIFFTVIGMMVNVRSIMEPEVLILGGVYTVVAIGSKIIGCGLPALALGFNGKGALRIGVGMIARGEVALIIAGIGLAAKILDDRLFGVVIMMTLASTLLAPAILNAALRLPGIGTRKAVRNSEDTVCLSWDFPSTEISDMVIATLLKDLRSEGFYVQMMNIDEGISQARKRNVALSLSQNEKRLSIETSAEDVWFVKTAVFEVLVKLDKAIGGLKTAANPSALRTPTVTRADAAILNILDPACVELRLSGTTKEEIISELAGVLHRAGRVSDRILVRDDVMQREKTMSTGMQNGVALPHAKTEGAKELCVAVGIKKEGIDFDSIDGERTRIFIMIASPKKGEGPHIQFLAAIGAVLKKQDVRERLLKAQTNEEAVALLKGLK